MYKIIIGVIVITTFLLGNSNNYLASNFKYDKAFSSYKSYSDYWSKNNPKILYDYKDQIAEISSLYDKLERKVNLSSKLTLSEIDELRNKILFVINNKLNYELKSTSEMSGLNDFLILKFYPKLIQSHLNSCENKQFLLSHKIRCYNYKISLIENNKIFDASSLINDVYQKLEKIEKVQKYIENIHSKIKQITSIDDVNPIRKELSSLNVSSLNIKELDEEYKKVIFKLDNLETELKREITKLKNDEASQRKNIFIIITIVGLLILGVIFSRIKKNNQKLKEQKAKLDQAKVAGFNTIEEYDAYLIQKEKEERLKRAQQEGFNTVEEHEAHLHKLEQEKKLKEAQVAGFNSIAEYNAHLINQKEEKERIKKEKQEKEKLEAERNAQRTIENVIKYSYENVARVTYSYNQGSKKSEVIIGQVHEVRNWTSTSVTIASTVLGSSGRRLIQTYDVNQKVINSYYV